MTLFNLSLRFLQVHNFFHQPNYSPIICMLFHFHVLSILHLPFGPQKETAAQKNHEEKLEFSYENGRNNYHRTEVTLMEKIKYRRS